MLLHWFGVPGIYRVELSVFFEILILYPIGLVRGLQHGLS